MTASQHGRSPALGVGLVGYGSVARKHVEALETVPGAELAALCRRSSDRPDGLDVAVHTDLAGMLDDPAVELVAICTPSGLHLDQAKQVVEAGKDVVIEKPIGLDYAKAEQLVGLARSRGVTVSVISQRRFEPHVQAVRGALTSGGLGRPVLGEASLVWSRDASYYTDVEWRGTIAQDGGALMNQGIHVVDLLVWLMGPVSEVLGVTATRVHRIEAEDTAVAALRFANGALGHLTATTAASAGRPAGLNLEFEHGRIAFDEAGITRWDVPGLDPPDVSGTKASGAGDPMAIVATDHAKQWSDILDAIASGRDPLVTGEEGLRTLGVVLAVHESASTGRAVAL